MILYMKKLLLIVFISSTFAYSDEDPVNSKITAGHKSGNPSPQVSSSEIKLETPRVLLKNYLSKDERAKLIDNLKFSLVKLDRIKDLPGDQVHSDSMLGEIFNGLDETRTMVSLQWRQYYASVNELPIEIDKFLDDMIALYKSGKSSTPIRHNGTQENEALHSKRRKILKDKIKEGRVSIELLLKQLEGIK